MSLLGITFSLAGVDESTRQVYIDTMKRRIRKAILTLCASIGGVLVIAFASWVAVRLIFGI